ncbi:50S ribosomal protein L31e [Candidatus Pacearchaeota archaeon]|nr:50S ribosomal protein L31e [Candidatus Pacearchaeota archaeon]
MAKKKSEPKTDKLEREYVIPIRNKIKHAVRYKKTPKAMKTIKEFLVRHMKVRDRDLSKVKIDGYLNEAVWQRGIKNPPHKIRVRAVKDGDIIRAELVDYPTKLKFKKARADKKALEALEKGKKKKVPKEEVKPAEKTDEEKKVEKEKAKAGADVTQKLEKAAAKKGKQQVGGKTKAPKRQIRKALAK